MDAPGNDLAPAALAIARVEYPSLDSQPYLATLDRMGEEAHARIGATSDLPQEESVRAFNEYLYDEQGFAGNRERYDDPRNSFLNEVLDRRTGIPISLAVIYLEVARRAGLRVDGMNFPGHFLLRAGQGSTSNTGTEVVIIDPFHGGAQLSSYDCRQLLRQHVGDDAAFDTTLLLPATRHDIVVRMLVNLKRLYVRMRSFPRRGSSRRCFLASTRPPFQSCVTAACSPTISRTSPAHCATSRSICGSRRNHPNTANRTCSPNRATATMRKAQMIPTAKKRGTTRRRSGST